MSERTHVPGEREQKCRPRAGPAARAAPTGDVTVLLQRLQRSAGNAAVTALLRKRGAVARRGHDGEDLDGAEAPVPARTDSDAQDAPTTLALQRQALVQRDNPAAPPATAPSMSAPMADGGTPTSPAPGTAMPSAMPSATAATPDGAVPGAPVTAQQPSAPATPPPPGPDAITFLDVQLSTDPAFVRFQLEHVMGQRGVEGEQAFVDSFQATVDTRQHQVAGNEQMRHDMETDRGSVSGVPLSDAEIQEAQLWLRVLPVVLEQHTALRNDNEQLIHQFEERARAIVLSLLQDNEQVARREAQRYGGSGDPQSDAAQLQAAARELADLKAAIDLAQQEAYDRSDRSGVPSDASGNPIPQGPGPDEARQRFETRKAIYGQHFPVLLAENIDFAAMANAAPATLQTLVQGETGRVLDNIRETRENVTSGRLSIWTLAPVIEQAKGEMGFRPGSRENAAIEGHIHDIQRDEALVSLALAALAIGLAIVATVATGGLAVAAVVAGAGVGVASAASHLETYNVQQAATHTALDPAAAGQISSDEPSFFWLAVDIVGAVLDLGSATVAFRNLVRSVKALNALRETVAAAETAQVEEVLRDVEESARAQARVLRAEGKLAEGMTEDIFVQRIVASTRNRMATAGEVAARRGGIVAEIMSPQSAIRPALLGGDRRVMQEVLTQHGNWQSLMEALSQAGPDGQQIGRHFLDWRAEIVRDLTRRFGARPVATASSELVSDVDLSTEGANAGAKLIEAEADMAQRFGSEWSSMFRMNFYTDASRLIQYEDIIASLEPAERAALQTRITALTEKFNFAQILQNAGDDPQAVETVTALAGGRFDMNELRALAALDEGARTARRNELLRELDGLVQEYRTATGPRRIGLAEEITSRQVEANFYTTEAYIGPGAGRMTVRGAAVIGPEAYQSALSDFSNVRHIIEEAGGDVVRAAREYELFKYINRFAKAAQGAAEGEEEAAKQLARELTYLEHESELLYRVDRGAHGETAHLYTPAEAMNPAKGSVRISDTAQDLGGLPPVTDDFLRQTVSDFMSTAERALPRLQQRATADPAAWAPTPRR